MLPETPVLETRSTLFPAMGGTVEMHAVQAPEGAAGRVRDIFVAHEAALSRFLPGSELSALNSAGGCAFAASPLLFDVLRRALEFSRSSRGLFDPTIIGALEAAGYDRTFDEVAPSGGALNLIQRPAGRWRDVRIDLAARTVMLPPGVRIDLGGIGKGYTVDVAARALGEGANALVNASGDLFAAGAGREGSGWRVGIADPHDPEVDAAVLQVRDRGVATSGPTRRAWQRGGRALHHLIDPRSGAPAAAASASVTVVARDAVTADVLATVACLMHPREALAFVASRGADAFIIDRVRAQTITHGMRRYLAP